MLEVLEVRAVRAGCSVEVMLVWGWLVVPGAGGSEVSVKVLVGLVEGRQAQRLHMTLGTRSEAGRCARGC